MSKEGAYRATKVNKSYKTVTAFRSPEINSPLVFDCLL